MLGIGGVVLLVVVGRGLIASPSQAKSDGKPPPMRIETPDSGVAFLDPATVRRMKISVATARAATQGGELGLSGQLYLEGSRRSHVHTRFAGEVIEMGTTTEVDNGPKHQLRVGDKVTKGQLLAVIWSKEIGEKKSDLVDAISQLLLHEAILRKLNQTSGAVAQRNIEEMQRNYEADLIQVSRFKRTLRSWRVPDEELQEIEREAHRIHDLQPMPGSRERPTGASEELERTWAEIDIRAPMDGVILEKNFTVGDIVDTTLDLFILGDLSRIGVMANVYEEDLPRLAALPPDERRWSVRLLANPEIAAYVGRFDRIGNVIDVNQHTAVVTGWLENPDAQLRIGQFVRATVQLPSEPHLVEVPVSAVLDEGPRSFVFMALNADATQIERRQVALARRTAETAWLRSQLPADRAAGDEKPVQPGERMVSSGVVELAGALKTLLIESHR
jgi:cobalt-zinc-cadmium efflux system membrane fusion protein